jgi:hypothetical protein
MSKHQFNYLLQKIEKEEYNLPRSNIICGVTSNLSTVSALQFNVPLLKSFIEVTNNTVSITVNNRKSTAYLIER